MPSKFLSIHGSYNCLDVSLFSDKTILESISKSDSRASSSLIPALEYFLQKHNLKFEDLSFIAVDRGPGAFTSLRVTLATVNGIAFDKKIKLVGVNGLEALISQNLGLIQNKATIAVALLNAYNNDVYFLISNVLPSSDKKFTILDLGCKKIDQLIIQLKNDFENHKIYFCGQGSQLYQNMIIEQLADQAVFPQEIQLFATSESVGLLAYDFWQNNQNVVDQIEPIYLKTQYFAIKK